jgi:GNAT superfamily N-acetyltransferase
MKLRLARPEEMSIVRAIDDDAWRLFDSVGITLLMPPDHPYAVEESAMWEAAARAGQLFFALEGDEPVAILVLDEVDGAPYLEQLSVRGAFGRRGIGRALVAHALEWSRARGELWLTTYGHVPWNRPYYERLGFSLVPERDIGPQMRKLVRGQRDALPDPEHRVVMVFRHLSPE